MEGLIIFLVVTLIGFVVNKAKGNSEEEANKRKQMPPMGQKPFPKSNQPKQSTQQRSGLGDYMKKVALELEKQFEEVPKKEVQKKVEKKLEDYKELETTRPLLTEQRAGREEYMRPTIERGSFRDEKKHVALKRNSIVPKTKAGIAQAIIMSEILAPPISKRRK